MRASSKRFTSILLAILMFIASLFIYSSLILPAYSEIINLRAEVVSRTQLVTEEEASIGQVQKLLSEYQDVAAIQDTISLILPVSQNVALGVSQISGLSKINNLIIDSLSMQELAIKPSTQSNLVKGIGTLRFNFHLIGSYENFKAFLQNLETNITLIDLASLKVDSGSKVGGNIFSYNITADMYYQGN